MPSRDEVWYKDGLRFTCTECGDCCRGAGFVWVDDEQIERLADYLKITPDEFSSRYVRLVGTRLSLIEKSNYDCIFWEDGKSCIVYPARPNQCRTFPFWQDNIESPADWEYIERTCPGSGQGKLYPVELIQKIVRDDAEASEV